VSLNREEVLLQDYVVKVRTQKAVFLNKQKEMVSEVQLKRVLGDEWSRKYKIFLTLKWQILKRYRENMEELWRSKMQKRAALERMVRNIAIFLLLRGFRQRLTRHVEIQMILRRSLFKVNVWARWFFKARQRYGSTMEIRRVRDIQTAVVPFAGGLLRPTLRERAKEVLLGFLREKTAEREFEIKAASMLDRIVLIQRMYRYRRMFILKEQWYGPNLTSADQVKMRFIMHVLLAKATDKHRREREQLKEAYRQLDRIREEANDMEGVMQYYEREEDMLV
jgi:hypothetical protein